MEALSLTLCGSLLVGCGPTSSSPKTLALTAGTRIKIIAHQGGPPDASYVPSPLLVHVGQTVTWTNTDSDPHDIIDQRGRFSSPPLGQSGVFRWTFLHTGTYHYGCTIHPEMHGEIIVRSSY